MKRMQKFLQIPYDEEKLMELFVNDFPEPVNAIGQKAVAYYDHERKKVYYEYEPAPQTERSRITMLEDALNDALLLLGKTNITVAGTAVSLMSISDTEKGSANIMMNGLAKYLATQIYLNKLNHDTVINTYPDIKDEIENYLSEMEVIPVIKAEDE